MKKAIVFIFLISLTILLTSQLSLAIDVPLPDNIKIISPSSEVPKEIAAFSGTWEGNWGGMLEAKLIIEEINAKQAKIIYSRGDAAPGWNVKKGYDRVSAKVTPGKRPQIEWGDGINNPKFIFMMNKDLQSLAGSRKFKGRDDKVQMWKK